MENILLISALEYARRGFYVFPCREIEGKAYEKEYVIPAHGAEKEKKETKIIIPKIKTPYVSGGFQVATLDEKQINLWWTKYPNAAIGISCGASNLVVVDIDVKDGRRGFDNFMSLHVSYEGALQSFTPSGGMHIIFSGLTDSHANVKAGIDLRSKGAYIIAPPSKIMLNREMKEYKALGDWSITPANVPDDLIKKLNLLRKGTENKIENKKEYPIDNVDELIGRLRIALNKLPNSYCDEYWSWVSVGIALKTLGEAGFSLWNEWSKKSSKYDYDALVYRWDKFDPREITIGSIFFWAKEAQNGN